MFMLVFCPTPLVFIGPARAVPCLLASARTPVPGRIGICGGSRMPPAPPAPPMGFMGGGGAMPPYCPPRLLGRAICAPAPPPCLDEGLSIVPRGGSSAHKRLAGVVHT
jgi:hypothetical protein